MEISKKDLKDLLPLIKDKITEWVDDYNINVTNSEEFRALEPPKDDKFYHNLKALEKDLSKIEEKLAFINVQIGDLSVDNKSLIAEYGITPINTLARVRKLINVYKWDYGIKFFKFKQQPADKDIYSIMLYCWHNTKYENIEELIKAVVDLYKTGNYFEVTKNQKEDDSKE